MPKTLINGIDLYYNIYIIDFCIILVHGLGMDHSMWELQAPELSKSHQVIVYDLKGRGKA